ncbi:hypothetical protein IEE94_05680 [Yimella sp. cx-573]|nr:hypothetical protein [Yimella sp. cx-573]
MRVQRSLAAAAVVAALGAASTTAHAAVDPVPYSFTGSPVTLANGPSGGPTLTAGVYRVTLPNDGSERSFTIDRNKLRSFMATVVTDEREGTSPFLTSDHTTEVKSVDEKGDECSSATDERGEDGPAGITVTNLGVDDDEELTRQAGYFNSTCRESTKLTITITHTASPANGQTQAEIHLTDEPKASGNLGSATTSGQTAMLKAPKGEEHEEVPPGQGFGSAATLTTGSYPAMLTVGSRAFYRVRVGWGQRLAATMTVPGQDKNFAPPLAVDVTLSIWSPQRVWLKASPKDYQFSHTTSLSKNMSESKTIGTYTAPVLWANRKVDSLSLSGSEVESAAVRFTTVPGWYYVTVNTQPKKPSDDEQLPQSVPQIPADLNILVQGQEQSGPSFVNAAGASVAQPPSGQMSVGQGIDQGTKVPWVQLGLSALAVGAAAAAVFWAMRSRRRDARQA